jgi:hypothetical protein
LDQSADAGSRDEADLTFVDTAAAQGRNCLTSGVETCSSSCTLSFAAVGTQGTCLERNQTARVGLESFPVPSVGRRRRGSTAMKLGAKMA